jgi:hypothetical protein
MYRIGRNASVRRAGTPPQSAARTVVALGAASTMAAASSSPRTGHLETWSAPSWPRDFAGRSFAVSRKRPALSLGVEIYEGNPPLILERRKPVTLVPMLIMRKYSPFHV